MAISEATRRRYLDAMGIHPWVERARAVPSVEERPPKSAAAGALISDLQALDAELKEMIPPPTAGATGASSPSTAPALDWEALSEAVRGCTRCGLHTSRTQTVFGVGDRKAQWMFVGEAPGADEDRQGEPFVGRAGQLLNSMLFALGLAREQVYIANVLKCRPPNNRDPQDDEVSCCEPYLVRQIELISPRLIVALGRHAAHSLLKTDIALAKLRGRPLTYHGIPLLVTYHPAYLLRNPIDKRKAWEDLRLGRAMVEGAA